jgi:hypothetical protein
LYRLQYLVLPWPDSLAIFIAGLLHGKDERGRMMRRNIMRYTLLSYVITLRRISFRVRKRFPTMDHVIDAGLVRITPFPFLYRHLLILVNAPIEFNNQKLCNQINLKG